MEILYYLTEQSIARQYYFKNYFQCGFLQYFWPRNSRFFLNSFIFSTETMKTSLTLQLLLLSIISSSVFSQSTQNTAKSTTNIALESQQSPESTTAQPPTPVVAIDAAGTTNPNWERPKKPTGDIIAEQALVIGTAKRPWDVIWRPVTTTTTTTPRPPPIPCHHGWGWTWGVGWLPIKTTIVTTTTTAGWGKKSTTPRPGWARPTTPPGWGQHTKPSWDRDEERCDKHGEPNRPFFSPSPHDPPPKGYFGASDWRGWKGTGNTGKPSWDWDLEQPTGGWGATRPVYRPTTKRPYQHGGGWNKGRDKPQWKPSHEIGTNNVHETYYAHNPPRPSKWHWGPKKKKPTVEEDGCEKDGSYGHTNYPPRNPHGSSHPSRDPHGSSYPPRDPHESSYPPRDPHGSSYPPRDPHGSSYPPRDPHGSSYPPQDSSYPSHGSTYPPQDSHSPSYPSHSKYPHREPSHPEDPPRDLNDPPRHPQYPTSPSHRPPPTHPQDPPHDPHGQNDPHNKYPPSSHHYPNDPSPPRHPHRPNDPHNSNCPPNHRPSYPDQGSQQHNSNYPPSSEKFTHPPPGIGWSSKDDEVETFDGKTRFYSFDPNRGRRSRPYRAVQRNEKLVNVNSSVHKNPQINNNSKNSFDIPSLEYLRQV